MTRMIVLANVNFALNFCDFYWHLKCNLIISCLSDQTKFQFDGASTHVQKSIYGRDLRKYMYQY